MKRAFWWSSLAVVLFLGAGPVRADSLPVIQGSVQMFEICPQSICNVAIFVGIFQGRIGVNPHAIGTVAVVVNHDPLPPVGESAAITGGAWEIHTLARTIRGGASGWLRATSDVTFCVDVIMPIASGAHGTLNFSGLLDHRPFPPTLTGEIYQ